MSVARPIFLFLLAIAMIAGPALGRPGPPRSVRLQAPSSYSPLTAKYDAAAHTKTFFFGDGTSATIGADGMGWRQDAAGRFGRPVALMLPQGRSAIASFGPSDLAIERRLTMGSTRAYVPGRIVVVFSPGIRFSAAGPHASAVTNDSQVNQVLRDLRPTSVKPLFDAALAGALGPVAARSRFGSGTIDPSAAYVVNVAGLEPRLAVARLRALLQVRYAEPDWTVGSFSTDPKPFSAWSVQRALVQTTPADGAAPLLPPNYGLQSSLESYLNAGGVDFAAAYAHIRQSYGQLPGQGEIITNVSIGDLTDQAMANNGDQYVQFFGPTTILRGGQRYLDFPSFPLIPTFASDSSGNLDPAGSVEFTDPFLGEVMLDFSVMAPLPHGLQRGGETGSGLTDLLGIAPGAQYRLVVPKQATESNIVVALLAAAQQQPRPNVISASLGFGFDGQGFPGRYLEEDPIAQAVIAAIVQNYGIVVCIAANDGTRIFTPAAVGPDGGSAATNNVLAGQQPTNPGDDGFSTIDGAVFDSGAIDVGGSTLDDIFASPPQDGGTGASEAVFPETRFDGSTDFSSGFGTRVNVSAPSDNIASFVHACNSQPCGPHDVIPILNGGTSASAPMTAAAAAVLLQVARLTGHPLTPAGVRDLLQSTGRALPQPGIIDRPFDVGPQIDINAAVEKLLRANGSLGQPQIVRLAVAQRQNLGGLGSVFEENTDTANIDLTGPSGTGQNAVSPISIAADVVNLPAGVPVSFALRVGNAGVLVSRARVPRITPSQIFAALGKPLASSSSRTVPVTFQVLAGRQVVASKTRSLTFSATDGTYSEALAASTPLAVPLGQPVTVSYDLGNVRNVLQPEIVISSIDHWSPIAAPMFRAQVRIPLSSRTGTISIPAADFASGGGVYGIGILQNPREGIWGEIAPVRIGVDGIGARPSAPELSAQPGVAPGHFLEITRQHPTFSVAYDVSSIARANGALLEISAPGPSIFNLFNPFTNQNGTGRDANGGDTQSSVLLPLGGTRGSATFNALSIGLTTSDQYDVRVIPTTSGNVVGQASEVVTLALDDGLTPGGEPLVDFDLTSGTPMVALVGFGPDGNPFDSQIAPYSPATGQYGGPMADDGTGQTVYSLLGGDASQNVEAAQQIQWNGSAQYIQEWRTDSGLMIGSIPIDASSQYFIIGGHVDPVRHRAAVLAWSALDGSDTIIPFKLGATLSEGTPINADNGTPYNSFYTAFDFDKSNGRAYLVSALQGDGCLLRAGGVTAVNIDAGNAAPFVGIADCSDGIASDQSGGDLYVTNGPFIAFPQLFPDARYQTVSEHPLGPVGQTFLGGRSTLFPTYDPVNKLLLVAYGAQNDIYTNNDATSSVAVIDVRSGSVIKQIHGFNFIDEMFGFNISIVNEHGIQIDPATRTGWTYGPGGVQIQQFSY
jgi:hypothetical protein